MRRNRRRRSSSVLGSIEARIRPSRRRARRGFELSCPALEPRTLLSTFTVSNTNDSGTGSLRSAIEQANLDTGTAPVQIDFNITSGTAPFTIAPLTPLPAITHSVVIDGYTQSGASPNTESQGDNAVILINLSGANDPSADGLLLTGAGSTVRGLDVTGFANGIHITGNGAAITGDFLGTNATGTAIQGNSNYGLLVDAAQGVTVGGTSPAARNLISGNGGNLVLDHGATNDLIQGDYIGTDATGTQALAGYYNRGNGIMLLSAPGNTIGGAVAGAGNLISGNADAIQILQYFGTGSAGGTVVQGNLIGTDVTGTQALGNNGNGVLMNSAGNNTIGGTSAGARNVISANGGGLALYNTGASNNLIQGNYIGVDISGARALGNHGDGIYMADSGGNTIGGTAQGAGNVISANGDPYYGGSGILMTSQIAGYNVIQGNFIGTDLTGTIPLGNVSDGLDIIDEFHNTIGGTAQGAGNVISANGGDGIAFGDVYASSNAVQGNFIGTDPTGTMNLGNGGDGVLVAVSNNTIGGTAAGAANIIAHNGGVGVGVQGGPYNPVSGVTILSNSIFGNAGLGIDLGLDGVTPNQPAGQTSATNDGQNYPVLLAAADFGAGYGTDVKGTLNEAPSTTYTLQFFANPTADPSGHGQGQTLLGTITVTTDSSGNAAFQASFPGETGLGGQVVSATATDPNGNTSEFAADIPIVAATPPLSATGELYNTDVNTTLTVAAPGVLTNDISADGGTFTAAVVTDPAHGVLALNADGSFTYQPSPDYIGVDSFTYEDVEGTATSSPATVTIDVNPKTYVVTTTADRGTGSLRWAIDRANLSNSSLPDTIQFNIPGTGVQTIAPATPLPAVTHGTIIDGYSQPGASASTQAQGDNATILIDLSGSNLPDGTGLTIDGNGSTVRGIAVGGFSVGIEVQASGVQVAGDFIGTDVTGSVARPNTQVGLLVYGGSGNTIGGTSTADRNLISGNYQLYYGGQNLEVTNGATGDLIEGNYIGTDATGTRGLANNPYYDHENGIQLSGAPGTTIGGTAAGAGNLISGNGADGIELNTGSDGTVIQGNLIGTDLTGTHALGNNWGGIADWGAGSLTIGGATAAARNLISGNGGGISLQGGGDNLVQGNYIGTDITGTQALGNTGSGISGSDYSSGNTIGGTLPGEGNLISANGFNSSNPGSGIVFNSEISGSNLIEGNKIGTDVSGTKPLGNANAGIFINSEGKNTIGGTAWGAGNIIAANGGDGIEIQQLFASNNVIQGNVIGTDRSRSIDLGNGGDGILAAVSNNTIGGTTWGAGNVIAYNKGPGVVVGESDDTNATGVEILSNSIFANGAQGIDLVGDGLTPGPGPNNYQAYPALGVAARVEDSSLVEVKGTLTSTPNTTFTVQFFANPTADPSGYGQGQYLLGTRTLTTDSGGQAAFQYAMVSPSSLGSSISATATDPAGNTSEFSNDVSIIRADSLLIAQNDQYRVDPGQTLTVAAPGVQANDIAMLDNTFTSSLVTAPAHGTLTLNPDGSFAYVPAAGYRGTDSFTYVDTSGLIQSNIATVSIDVNPITYVVTSTSDSGTGSLRWAITQANRVASSDPVDITFDIPGTGPFTIAPASPLPEITHSVVIDGYTQPGASPNTSATSDNAVLEIILSGRSSYGDGLSVGASNSIIQGLDIVSFSNGIHLLSGASGDVVSGNFIGINAAGNAAQGNYQGVLIDGASGNTIGGTTPDARNVVSASGNQDIFLINSASGNLVEGNFVGLNAAGTGTFSTYGNGIIVYYANNNTIGGTAAGAGNVVGGLGIDGIQIGGSSGTLVEGNLVGTDPTDSIALPNGTGIGAVYGASNNTIGGTVAGAGNVIANNSGAGVSIGYGGTGDAILSNAIVNNGGPGISLAPGANNNQAPPTLGSASYSSGTTTIAGTLSGQQADTNYVLQFFANVAADPSGAGEGQTLLGTETVTTDGSGNATFSFALATQDTTNQYVSATATDPNGNTSAFATDVLVANSVAPIVAASPAAALSMGQVASPGITPLVSASSSPAATAAPPVAIGALTDAALNDLAGNLPRSRRRSGGA
ncbi:MAG: Ig-like domain-containing protein [Isosphaeraceae bacterium]